MATGLTQYDAIPLTGLPAVVRYQLSSVFPPPSSGAIAACDGLTPGHAVWYSYTTPNMYVELAINVQVLGAPTTDDFSFNATVFEGTPGALTVFNGGSAGNDDCCIRGSGNPWIGYMQAPLKPLTTYYFQFGVTRVPDDAGILRTVQIDFINPSFTVAPSGSVLITSDQDGYPAVVFDPVTGTKLQVRNAPATEFADGINGTGELAFGVDETHNNGVVVFDHDMGSIGSVTLPANNHLWAIRSDRSGTFYYLYQSFATNHFFIGTISKAGVVGGTTWDLGTNVAPQMFAVKRDGTIAYFGKSGGVVGRFDLIGNVAMSNLAGAIPNYALQSGDGFVFSDDTIFVGYVKASSPVNAQVIRYDPAGTVHQTYALPLKTSGSAMLNHFAIHPDDASFVVWQKPNTSSFVRIRISDGSTLSTSPDMETDVQNSGVPFPLSGSCPIVVLPLAMAPPTAPPTPTAPLAPPHSVPITFVPTPVPNAPQAPCDPQAQVSGGGRGQFGCNPGGVGWVSSYTGPYGSVPQHADPVDGETLEGKEDEPIDLWIELVHTDENDVVTTYRRAMRELADHPNYEGGRKPAGLISIGDIEHGLGNEQGGFEAATIDILYADQIDRLFRDLLDTDELEGDDLYVKLASREGRASGEP
jgi:hypothetical protein